VNPTLDGPESCSVFWFLISRGVSLKPAAFELFGAVVVLLKPHDSRGGELVPGGAALPGLLSRAEEAAIAFSQTRKRARYFPITSRTRDPI